MRPKGLTAICIIGIVLSGLGFIALTGGLFWWVMGVRWGELMLSISPGVNQQQAELQKTLYEELATMQQRWAPLTITLMILQVVLVVLLFVACVRGLKMKAGARRLLATAMVFAILLELGRIYPNVIIQRESQQISMRYTDRVMQTAGNPAQTRAIMSFTKRAQQVGMAVGYLFMAAWLIAKLSYYGTGLWYVNRKSVKLLFEPEVPDTSAESPPAAQPDGS